MLNLTYQGVISGKKGENLTDNDEGRKNRLLKSALVGLSILSALSIGSCCQNKRDAAQAHSEVAVLTEKASHLQKDVSDLSSENQKLKNYAEEANKFAINIQCPYTSVDDLEHVEGDDVEAIEEEKRMKKEYDKACKVLGIDQIVLEYLQKGYTK